MDQNCAVPGLRGTGIIEPAKFAWTEFQAGEPLETVCAAPSLPCYTLLLISEKVSGLRASARTPVVLRDGSDSA
jgi:hypothetical protein